MGEILESLGVDEDVPMFGCRNKIDMLSEDTRRALLVQDARTPGIHAVSALTGDGAPALLEAITAALDEERTEETLMLSFSNGRGRAWLHDESVVTGETQTDEGYEIAVRLTATERRASTRFNRASSASR